MEQEVGMYKNILVPLDGSSRAEAILPHVESIAKNFKATIHLLRVLDFPLMLERDEVVDLSKTHLEFEKKKKEVADYLEQKKRDCRKDGVQAETRMVSGSVVETILKIAEETNADLIAMASHGFGGSQRAFYGSVAAGILHRIDRPLLIIRNGRNL